MKCIDQFCTVATRCLGRAGDKQRLQELGENMEGVRTFTEIQVRGLHC